MKNVPEHRNNNNINSYSFMDNFELPVDDVNGARQIYGSRTSALPPLVLEQCGGKLNETKVLVTGK